MDNVLFSFLLRLFYCSSLHFCCQFNCCYCWLLFNYRFIACFFRPVVILWLFYCSLYCYCLLLCYLFLMYCSPIFLLLLVIDFPLFWCVLRFVEYSFVVDYFIVFSCLCFNFFLENWKSVIIKWAALLISHSPRDAFPPPKSTHTSLDSNSIVSQ